MGAHRSIWPILNHTNLLVKILTMSELVFNLIDMKLAMLKSNNNGACEFGLLDASLFV